MRASRSAATPMRTLAFTCTSRAAFQAVAERAQFVDEGAGVAVPAGAAGALRRGPRCEQHHLGDVAHERAGGAGADDQIVAESEVRPSAGVAASSSKRAIGIACSPRTPVIRSGPARSVASTTD